MNKLENIAVGDVILAKRYKTQEEGDNIARGHRNGPYVVMRIKEDCVYGFYCSSKEPLDKNKIKYYVLDIQQADFAINKVTYVFSNNVEKILKEQYVNTIGHLAKKDILGIQKLMMALSVRKDEAIAHHYNTKEPCYNYNIGDIIKYNYKLYFIYNRYNKNYCISPITTVNEFGISTCHGIRFKIDYKKRRNISIEFNNETVSLYFVDKKTLGDIKKVYKELLAKKVENKGVKVGSVIRDSGELFYVYNICNDIWQTFKIYTNAKNVPDCIRLEIAKGKFFTFLEKKDILVSTDKKARHNAKKEQILKINQQIRNWTPTEITLSEDDK